MVHIALSTLTFLEVKLLLHQDLTTKLVSKCERPCLQLRVVFIRAGTIKALHRMICAKMQQFIRMLKLPSIVICSRARPVRIKITLWWVHQCRIEHQLVQKAALVSQISLDRQARSLAGPSSATSQVEASINFNGQSQRLVVKQVLSQTPL